ncbi:Crp/Fnr family transcriptional regulator [Lutibacter sp.]|uniref:Crp/Fnr family transcriptional regulator n=1 Tax=Lutibacter sp. TaxID=1925666 RepID=UPI002736E15E|nr:Crp/Fnr family transcriptional regulator [Lutibacter sp.]MDP3314165.1 Crp/Fnr family transcriptional regulator [Lutibacter sp.]
MKIHEIVENSFATIFEENLRHELCNYGVLKKTDPEKIIVDVRRDIEFIPLVIDGNVKVLRRDGKGNGVFLHFITKNQTSAIAIAYALENKKSEIRLEAETELTYIAIPSEILKVWFVKYQSWRSFFFKLNQQQTSYLVQKINNISFENLEYNLQNYLKENSEVHNNKTIFLKHFDIARDLKVSREAISRTLKKLEKDEVISLGRNKIILN